MDTMDALAEIWKYALVVWDRASLSYCLLLSLHADEIAKSFYLARRIDGLKQQVFSLKFSRFCVCRPINVAIEITGCAERS